MVDMFPPTDLHSNATLEYLLRHFEETDMWGLYIVYMTIIYSYVVIAIGIFWFVWARCLQGGPATQRGSEQQLGTEAAGETGGETEEMEMGELPKFKH